MDAARTLFGTLNAAADLERLKGTPEDLHLEVKECHAPLPANMKGYLSQALSGFANSDGGVLVLGMTAKGGDLVRGEPDVIQSAKPFKGFRSVAGEVRRLLGQAVQPVVDGVDVREIESIRSGDFGYVVVLVPASDAGPHRAMLKNGGDREFWKRSGDSFYRMEVFDIADMFGRRRRPMLVLIWRVSLEQSPDDQRVFKWSLILGLSNEGRALARYPMLDLVCPLEAAPDTRYGLDGNGREGLSRRPTVGAVKDKKVRALYVGDAGTVIHPGTDLDIAKTVSLEGIAYRDRQWSFKPATLNLRYRISAEDFPVTEHELALGYNEFVDALRSPLGF